MKYICLFAVMIGMGSAGCSTLSSIAGVTGANDGRMVDPQTIEYRVTHPGLDITIREDYAPDLLPIETVGNSANGPLRHTVRYGRPDKLNVLEIIGKYTKEIHFNGRDCGSLLTGTLLIDRGNVFLDGEQVKCEPQVE